MASRHLSRISALQALFSADLRGDLSKDAVLAAREQNTSSLSRDDEDQTFTTALLVGVCAKRDEIDAVIVKTAPQWPLHKIAPIDRNVLRIGLYELLFGAPSAVPPKVALNESIELAKLFGSDASGRFVNGVLGSVYKELGSPRVHEAPKSNMKEFLAGIVVCAVDGGKIFVALIKDPFEKWTLPKTRFGDGELSDRAALRAAREELGLEHVTLSVPLGENEYEAHTPGVGVVVRRVGYFLGSSHKEPLATPKTEKVLDVAWFREDKLPEEELYHDLRHIIESGIVAARRGIV